jgi:protein-disulfide isomerase
MSSPDSTAALLILDPNVDHALGPASAAATLVEYGDFECPSCRQAQPAVNILLSHYGDRLRFAFRHFPLREVHPHAEIAAEAAEAAGAQQQFWPFHDLLFAHQGALSSNQLLTYALQLGLDLDRFDREIEGGLYRSRVQSQVDSGIRLGLRGTPAFFVNGRFVDVSFGLARLQAAVEAALD